MGIFSKETVKRDLPLPVEIVKTFNETSNSNFPAMSRPVTLPPEPPDNRPYSVKLRGLMEEHLKASEAEEGTAEEVKRCDKQVEIARVAFTAATQARAKAAEERRTSGEKLANILGYRRS